MEDTLTIESPLAGEDVTSATDTAESDAASAAADEPAPRAGSGGVLHTQDSPGRNIVWCEYCDGYFDLQDHRGVHDTTEGCDCEPSGLEVCYC